MLKEIENYLSFLNDFRNQVKTLLEGLPKEALDKWYELLDASATRVEVGELPVDFRAIRRTPSSWPVRSPPTPGSSSRATGISQRRTSS